MTVVAGVSGEDLLSPLPLHVPSVSRHPDRDGAINDAHPLADVVLLAGRVEEGEREGRDEQTDAEPVQVRPFGREPHFRLDLGRIAARWVLLVR